MASTYSNLKIELMGTGDQSGTWGTTTNTNLGTAIEEAITGTADVSFSSADVTLTLTNTNTAQTARNLRLNLTGSVAAAQNLIVPSIEKQYIINNGLTFAITVKNSTGTGVAVPAGKSMIVFNTGSNVVETVTALGTGTVLPVANGGTGVTTSTGTTNVVLSNSPALTGTPTAPTAAPGTNTTQIATTAFVTAVTGTLGTMSTQNANNVAITGGTINGAIIGQTTPAVGTFTTLSTTGLYAAAATTIGEVTTVVGSGATGTINCDFFTSSILYYTGNATANWTLNFRASSTVSVNTMMANGETRTYSFLATQGSPAYYNNAVRIDNVLVTPKWQGGITPTTGNANSIDVYTYAITKLSSATYTVIASFTKFA
jgi:hypothetical protein